MHSTTQIYNYYSTANIKLAKKGANELVPQNLLDGNLKIKPTTDRAYKYKYNGKEWQDELGLAWHDYGARNYEPNLGRFAVIDPMTDFVSYQSPYVTANNNPVQNIDYYGLGIINVLENLFKQVKNGVKNLFRKGCFKPQVQESIGVAWSRDDFPSYKKRRNRKTTANSNNNGDSTRDYISPFPTSTLELVSLETQLNTELQLAKPIPSIPEFNGIPITSPIHFDRKVTFNPNSDDFKDVNYTDKILTDLVKTLKEYPQLKVLILSNYSINGFKKVNRDSKNRSSGLTVGELQLKRSRAVEQFLISKGINWRRISVGYGDIKFEGEAGRTTKFTLKN